jgi:hypothetical protein
MAQNSGALPGNSPAQATVHPGGHTHAPVLVIHGVGSFADGALVEQIAQHWSEGGSAHTLRRQSLYVGEQRYTTLEGAGSPGDGPSAAAGSHPALPHTRFLELNWSDIRRAGANVWGLLRHFALVFLVLTRLGTEGIEGSRTLSSRLSFRMLVLLVVETLLFWTSLLPALSALLWAVGLNKRLAVGLIVAALALYAASWLRRRSGYLALGALLFAAFALWAGFEACVYTPSQTQSCLDQSAGQCRVTYWAGAIHSALVIAAGTVLLWASVEIMTRHTLEARHLGSHPRQTKRLLHRWLRPVSRLACLWLPAVMLSSVQPVTVAAVLLTMNEGQRDNWGQAFQLGVVFSAAVGYGAAMFVLLAFSAAVIAGALQYLAVRWCGHWRATAMFFASAVLLVLIGKAAINSGSVQCVSCMRPDALWLAAACLTAAGILGLLLTQYRAPHVFNHRTWHPAGKYARLWAALFLLLAPAALVGALIYLFHETSAYSALGPEARFGKAGALTASDYILQASQLALVALPLAAKPLAAVLDALGDVFFWFSADPPAGSKLAAISSKEPSRARFAHALQHLQSLPEGARVVVFAHSQGTVIAAHSLSAMAQQLKDSGARVTLVTLGSPITSLYEKFFAVPVGHGFARLCQDLPDRFAWLNCARAADYIGSAIEISGVQNFELGTNGDHSGYWSDPALLRWLERVVQGRDFSDLLAVHPTAPDAPSALGSGPHRALLRLG